MTVITKHPEVNDNISRMKQLLKILFPFLQVQQIAEVQNHSNLKINLQEILRQLKLQKMLLDFFK